MQLSVSLRHAILSHIYLTPMHGYRLRQVASRHSWIYPIKHSSIYPALHDLERDGLVSHHSEVHGGRARKIYSITDAGREELESWLATSPELDTTFSDTVAFKISVQRDRMVHRSRDWMTATIARLREKIDECERDLESQVDATPYALLAVEYGIDMLKLRTRLLERVLATADVGDSCRIPVDAIEPVDHEMVGRA